MIPIKNKKKSLEMTVEEMRNFSFAYIEKYAPSKQQLKTYLLKKYLKTKIPNTNKKNLTNLIDVVLQDLEKTKFINDKFYSNTKARTLIQKGSSINKIRNYLISKGINDRYIKETIVQIKENALKDIKNVSIKISMEATEHLIKNSIDKNKLDKIYSESLEQTKTSLKNLKV